MDMKPRKRSDEDITKFEHSAPTRPVELKPATSDWVYPWDNPSLDEYATKLTSIKLDEITREKLRWVCERTPQCSAQKFMIWALRRALDEQIARIIDPKNTIEDIMLKPRR